MSSEENRNEVDALRSRLAEYEEAFRVTAPRLAAFKQLEDLAREQRTSPEAIAAKVTLDTLRQETTEVQDHLREFLTEREGLQAEMSLVLIQKRTHDDRAAALRAEVEALREVRDSLREEGHGLVIQRDDLLKERDELVAEKAALVTAQQEVQNKEAELQARRDELSALEDETSLRSTALRNDLAALMEHKQKLVIEVEALSTELDHRRLAIEDSAQSDDEASSEASEFTQDEDNAGTEEAFDRFFDADIDHDKSRDWILG